MIDTVNIAPVAKARPTICRSDSVLHMRLSEAKLERNGEVYIVQRAFPPVISIPREREALTDWKAKIA